MLSPSLALTFALNLEPEPEPRQVRNKDAVYMHKHGKAELLGAVEVELRTLLSDVAVHALELPLSRNKKVEGQLHLKLRWETGVADWTSADEANARVSQRFHAPTDLVSAKQKIDKYVSAIDLHNTRVSSLEEAQKKVRLSESRIEDVMEEEQELMAELRT